VQRAGKRERSGFFYARVAVLLAILFGVVLYAWHDVRARHARNEWDHTLHVAVIMVRQGPVDDEALAALRARMPAAQERLAAEMSRYRTGPPPFTLHALGPVDATAAPPVPAGDGVLDAARHSLAMARWAGDLDTRGGVLADAYDVRIYVVARRPPANAERTMVEGRGEQGGRLGVVEVELDDSMADLALIVVAHELLHTLGATDKYDARGKATVPDGLAEPDKQPLFPQRFAEIMARNRPLDAAGAEAVPERLDEVAVGPATAREIGWLR
jgi:hypothetical protein